MWGNHCEYIYANQRYGNGGTAASVFRAPMQGLLYANEFGLNAYLNAIENFNPNAANDVHSWIPQGLPYDLFDNNVDFSTAVNDNVIAAYTNRNLFDALLPNTRSIPQYRISVLQINNLQAAAVNDLFTSYNY